MKQLMIERETLSKQRGSVCIRRNGSSSVISIPLGDVLRWNEASEAINR